MVTPHPYRCRLLLFLRYPQSGQTKTRLIPAIGAAGAAALQRCMAKYLVQHLQHPNWVLQVHFSGASRAAMQALLGPELAYYPQTEGALGDRLWYGLAQASQHGLQANELEKARSLSEQAPALPVIRTIAIGADCPELSSDHIQQAFNILQDQDLVIGPASDGGYYLIGLRQVFQGAANTSMQSLFQDIDWSTSRVFQQTMQKAQQLGLSHSQLETLSDIDRPEDLAILERLRHRIESDFIKTDWQDSLQKDSQQTLADKAALQQTAI